MHAHPLTTSNPCCQYWSRHLMSHDLMQCSTEVAVYSQSVVASWQQISTSP
uniref:Uncharacterized protein n=1 Tax=Setaria italica TaxID=4555 RepID=K3Z210_SETIT